MNIPRALLIGFILICACPAPSRASAKLFPADLGSNSVGEPMKLRLIRTTATIQYGLADVDNEYRFENEAYEQVEGVLRTRIPANGVVTRFGYYFKGVLVPGRIMENEEAERIYRAITGAGRDPALLRRKADGSYEARIFPIEPRSEVRVELQYRYLLPETPGRLKYQCPLATGNTGQPVDRVTVRTRFSGDAVSGILHQGDVPNLNPDPAAPKSTAEMTYADFEGSDVALNEDLQVTALLAEGGPPSQFFYSSDGEPGYWGLRVRGGTGKLPKPVLRGLHVWDQFPGVTVPGTNTQYWFGRLLKRPSGNRPAQLVAVDTPTLSPYWAQAYTRMLAARYRRHHRPKDKELVIELSKQYLIDTELTSYLAIPDSEWAAYQDRLDQAKRQGVEQYSYEADRLRWVAQLPRWVVPGDPVIRVKHRPELVRVTALLPDGDVLELRLDPTTGTWEARFDIPEGAREGAYPVLVVLQELSGLRSEVQLTYQVDLTSPTGALRFIPDFGGRVQLTTGADTARAVAFLADDTRVALQASEARGGSRQFTAALGLPPGRHTVRIRIYDRVHNWIELEDEIAIP